MMTTNEWNWDEIDPNQELSENEKMIEVINSGNFAPMGNKHHQSLESLDPKVEIRVRTKVLAKNGMTWQEYKEFEKSQLKHFFNKDLLQPHPQLFSKSSGAEADKFIASMKENEIVNFESAADRTVEYVVNKIERSTIQHAFELKRELINEAFYKRIISNNDRIKALNDTLQEHMENFYASSHEFDLAQKKHYEATIKHDEMKPQLAVIYQSQFGAVEALSQDSMKLDGLATSALSTLRHYYLESARASMEAGTNSLLEEARKKHIQELTDARATDRYSVNPQTGEVQAFKKPSWRDRIALKIESLGATSIADKIRGTVDTSIRDIAEKQSFLERQVNLKVAADSSKDSDTKMRLESQRNLEQALRELDKYKQTKLVSSDTVLEYLELKIRNYEYLINDYIEKIAKADLDLSVKRKRLQIEKNNLSFKNQPHPMHGELLVRVAAIEKSRGKHLAAKNEAEEDVRKNANKF